MMRKATAGLLLLLAVGACLPAYAQPQLNGVALHSELGKEQFMVGLYTHTPNSRAESIMYAQEDKRVEIKVLANRLFSKRFTRLWMEGIAINAGFTALEKHAQNMATFANMLTFNLVRGDIFAVERKGNMVYVSVNDIALGHINEPRFFDVLLQAWIGEVPLSSGFRQALLATGQVPNATLARFNRLQPDEQRIAQVHLQQNPPTPTPTPTPQATPVIAPPNDQIAQVLPSATPTPTPVPLPSEEPAPDWAPEKILVESLYQSKLRRAAKQEFEYPRRAADKGQEGNVRLRVTINRSGQVKKVDILEKSKYATINRAAKNTVRRSGPYLEVPEEISGEEYQFNLLMVFKLKEA